MSQFEDEIYFHLTKPENFEPAFEIFQKIPSIRKRLLVEFWNLVKVEIHEIQKNQEIEISKKFKVELSGDIFERWSYLSLTYFENLAVTYETLDGNCYYGLWINKGEAAPHRALIDRYRMENNLLPGFNSNESWVGWTNLGYDFNNIQGLLKILPDQREINAKDLAIRLTSLAEELLPHLAKIKEMMEPSIESN